MSLGLDCLHSFIPISFKSSVALQGCCQLIVSVQRLSFGQRPLRKLQRTQSSGESRDGCARIGKTRQEGLEALRVWLHLGLMFPISTLCGNEWGKADRTVSFNLLNSKELMLLDRCNFPFGFLSGHSKLRIAARNLTVQELELVNTYNKTISAESVGPRFQCTGDNSQSTTPSLNQCLCNS